MLQEAVDALIDNGRRSKTNYWCWWTCVKIIKPYIKKVNKDVSVKTY